jgi:thiol-disulfide isomerase/thioredoxin
MIEGWKGQNAIHVGAGSSERETNMSGKPALRPVGATANLRLVVRPRYALPLVVFATLAFITITSAHAGTAQDAPSNLVVHKAPKTIASIKFEDEKGQARSLADFKGEVVVFNIWATWCLPCRREMPTLDRLQAALAGPDFEVVPVSIDRGGIDAIRKFYADTGVWNLAMYVDTSGQVLRELGAIGLPTTRA